MNINNMKVMKIGNSFLSNEVQNDDKNAVYCEMKYKRDRSSYAGIVFKLINDNNDIIIRETEEKLIQNICIYEKIYIGSAVDYVKAIQRVFNNGEKKYGLEVLFLVYSDIRSSQVIFEELMKNIIDNADELKKL